MVNRSAETRHEKVHICKALHVYIYKIMHVKHVNYACTCHVCTLNHIYIFHIKNYIILPSGKQDVFKISNNEMKCLGS